MLAGECGCVAAVDLLVRRGADLHLLDSLGHDVLHYAKLSGSAEVRAIITAALQHHPAESGDYPTVRGTGTPIPRYYTHRILNYKL